MEREGERKRRRERGGGRNGERGRKRERGSDRERKRGKERKRGRNGERGSEREREKEGKRQREREGREEIEREREEEEDVSCGEACPRYFAISTVHLELFWTSKCSIISESRLYTFSSSCLLLLSSVFFSCLFVLFTAFVVADAEEEK